MNNPNHIVRPRSGKHIPIITLLNKVLTEIFWNLDIQPDERVTLLSALHDLMKETKKILKLE